MKGPPDLLWLEALPSIDVLRVHGYGAEGGTSSTDLTAESKPLPKLREGDFL